MKIQETANRVIIIVSFVNRQPTALIADLGSILLLCRAVFRVLLAAWHVTLQLIVLIALTKNI